MNEKSLIKQQKYNIFKKIFNFIKSFFSSPKVENTISGTESHKKPYSLQDEFQKNKKLLDLQKSFENGDIQEQDLSEEEKKLLVKLYHQQINDLDKDIQNYSHSLQFYNNKILITQNKSN